MLRDFKKWRRVSNLLGTFFSLISLISFVASIPFFIIEGTQIIGYSLLFSSLGLNYLITLVLSLELINSQNREDLFINFCLFIFLIFPLVGIFLYFALGFDSLHKDDEDKYTDLYMQYKKYEIQPVQDETKPKELGSDAFVYNWSRHQTPVYKNILVTLLDNSHKFLLEITSLIKQAKKYIHMEFYMFNDGFIFEHIFNLLKTKVKEGIEVRLIIDYVGKIGRLSKQSLKKLRRAGIQVRIFNPLFRSNYIWWQFRNHNKIIVVDNKYALFGSCNIADEYFNITKKYFQTTELSAKLCGPIVNSVSALFLTHWDLSNRKSKRNKPEFNETKCQEYFEEQKPIQSDRTNIAQFLDHSPIGSTFIVRDNLMQLIFGAKKSIVISTPYFYPPKEIVNALKLAKDVGISIKILVPKNPDLIDFFRTLNRQPFETLIEHGIEIYEYFGFNHEKIMIVDEEIVYFGSYNWDYRTLYLNFESALLVKCKKTAEEMNKFMNRQFSNSHMITKGDLKKSKNPSLFNAFVRLFKPFL